MSLPNAIEQPEPHMRAWKFVLRATSAQEALLRRFSGQARWVWNHALAEHHARDVRKEPHANYNAMALWLTAWRTAPETVWLAQSPVHAQQQVLKRLDAAFQRYFAPVKARRKLGYPRFKKYGDDPGLRFPVAPLLDQANGRLKLPKLGWVRLRQSQAVAGEIRNATVRRDAGKWTVAIQTRHAGVLPAGGLSPSLGIDVGIATFAADSSGRMVEPLNALKAQAVRLRRYQRSVSRKVKGSCNRKKAVIKLRALHKMIANQRSDWLHKLTTGLAREHAVIAIEDLRVANMSASAKGAVEHPGAKVRQKAGLNKAILDQGWSEFARQLAYKLESNGGALVKVSPAYTSQTCSCCGHVDKLNRKTQASFVCVVCGHAEHADTNAAKNILAAGHAVWTAMSDACGGDGSGLVRKRKARPAAVKQELTEAIVPAQQAEHA